MTELMIVIVIIIVLAALLFPLVSGMREKARGSVCAQNLRQIGIALNGHISENNGSLPNGAADTSYNVVNGNELGTCWYDAAAANMGREFAGKSRSEWLRLPDVFGCPSGYKKAYINDIQDGINTNGWPYTGDYAANMFLGNPANPLNPLRLSALNRPESTPYVQDTVKQNQFGPAIYGSGFSRTANSAFAARHNGRGNILWVDGHVSSLTYDEYMKFANDPKHGGAANFIRGNW